MAPEKIFGTIFFLIFLFTGCASSTSLDYPVFRDEMVAPYRHGNVAGVAANLKNGAATTGPDRLVFMLNRALALHTIGHYEESNEVLWEAEKISQVLNFESPDKLRLNNTSNMEWKYYDGDEFESVLLSVYHSFNYAFLGKNEDAVNEIRRAENKVSRMNVEGKRKYPMPAFFRYWSGILYEREHNAKPAKSDFELVLGMDGSTPELQLDFFRAATRAASPDDVEKIRRQKNIDDLTYSKTLRDNRDKGIVIVLLQNSFVGEKIEHPQFPEIPTYKDPWVKFKFAAVYVDGEEVGRTQLLFDVTKLAKENYATKLAQYTRDKAEGVPPDKIRRGKPDTRAYRGYDKVVKLTADLRHWNLLPSNFQVARVPVYPGIHSVMLRLEDENGRRGPFRDLGEVDIQSARDSKILTYRSINE